VGCFYPDHPRKPVHPMPRSSSDCERSNQSNVHRSHARGPRCGSTRSKNRRHGSACVANRSLGKIQHKAIAATPPFQVPDSDDATQPSTGVGAWRKEQEIQMTRVQLAACHLPSTVSCAFYVLYTSVGSFCTSEHGPVLVSSRGEHCYSSREACCARRVWAT
jgi:hypothetical protein